MQCKFSFSFLLILLVFTFLHTTTPAILERETTFDSPESIQLLRLLRFAAFDIFGRTGTDARSLDIAKKLNTVQEQIPDDVPFPCDVKGWRSSRPPTSVHRLKPGDIDIIASMGDSLSAGTGAFGSNVFHIVIDNRGVAGAGGGQGTWRQYFTLANIMKEFNPNLYGYAIGDFLTAEEGSRFNIAEAAAESKDMPYMASILFKRLKNNPKVDMEKHWKHISLMIGSNDFCSELCYASSETEFLKNHERDIVQTLRIIRDNIPRAFVSLIPPPNLKVLVFTREGRPSLKCYLTTNFECPCLFGLNFRKKRLEYFRIMERWQLIDYQISKYPEFQRNDFAVVLQPILMNITFPLASDGYADMTYLAPDCFHISQKMNSFYARSLWNSLLTPIQKKSMNVFASDKILCPTKERPYLSTYSNEGMTESSSYGLT